MSKNKLRNKQKTYLSTRMRIVIGASIFAAASLLLIVVFNLSDVKETRAFSSGDYRAIASGDWEQTESWEVYDGESWSGASMPPGPGVSTILVTKGTELNLSEELAVSNIIIDDGAQLNLHTNVLKIASTSGKAGIVVNGTLDLGTTIVEGNGDFTVGNKAKLMIGSDAGIDKKCSSGNIQLKGKLNLSRDAVYTFNGSVMQHTGNGLPSIVRELVINNNSGVTLDQSFIVLDKLVLEKGIMHTGRFLVTVGVSSVAPATIVRTQGAVSGKLKRWYGPINLKDVSFPMSDGTSSTVFEFTTDIQEYQKGMIEVVSHPGSLSEVSKNPFDARQIVVGITEKGYYTALLSNGPEEAWMKIASAVTGTDGINKVSWKITKAKIKAKDIPSGSDGQTVKLEQNEGIQNIVFGPNPFKDTFFVRFYSDIATTAHVQLVNAGGQMVYNEPMNVYEGSNQFEYVSKNDLPPGVYMLRISNTSEIHTMKVIRDK